jgi:hypothetical protein
MERTRSKAVMDQAQIQQNATVVGADGVPIGLVDRIEGRRMKITRPGALTGKKHYVDIGMVAKADGAVVRLSANADVALLLEDDED